MVFRWITDIGRQDRMRLILGLLLLFSLFFLNTGLHAQDIHFSQFLTTPLLTNPANTGMTDGAFRFANNYRTQWAKIGVSYNTLYTSFDRKMMIADKTFGIGGGVIHDQSASYNLTSNEFLLSFSYSKFINNQQITFGLQPGFIYKSYDPSKLTYSSQFDQVSEAFNINLPTSESGLVGHLNYFDLNIGIFWRTLFKNIMPSAGFSIRHINQPKESFSSYTSGTHLPMKLTFNGEVIIPLGQKFELTPAFLYGYTTGAHETVVGAMEGYRFTNYGFPIKEIYTTTMFRLNPMRDIDALILGGGLKFINFELGITYDINISPLSQITNFNGAFEISLVFTGGHTQRRNVNEPCNIY